MKTGLRGDVFLLYIAVLQALAGSVTGDCLHNGRAYMKHTVWQPGPCTVCTCEDPIVLCETIRCTDPQCDYSKGEYLQISADSCCPECVPHLSPCYYQDKTIPHNTEWKPEPCISCSCSDGEVACVKLPCPATHCKPGEITQSLPGQCCPQCIPAGRSCMYNGDQKADGSVWEPLPCTKCVCLDGRHSCYPIHCPAIVCPQNQHLETLPGTCCPVCQGHNNTCFEGDVEFRTGNQWQREPCTLCVCIGGTVVCTENQCMDIMACNRNDIQVTRQGECCPECVPNTGACMDVDPVRYSGDIWNTSVCEYCSCSAGEVRCHTAACENIICYKEEVMVHLPGTCCPQCIIPPSCESAGHTYQDGDVWYPDACSMCLCNSGETTCYQQHCPVCPTGQVSVSLPGDCCGQCKPVTCEPYCAKCEPGDPSNCTVCANPELYVQDGHCVQTCRMGFYPSPQRVCRPCDETCYTCVGGTPHHCDMCQPGLMWKHGGCVAQCGAGYYLQNGKCLECAASCKSCNGASPDQCISCSHGAQVVFNGRCVDRCPDNFYVRAGHCIACHPTCKTCTPDGTSCSSCWQGGLLHEGQCVTRCSIGFYPNTEGSCSPCHPACESCGGGVSKNCTSCFSGGKISKKGKCRSPCPRGEYLSISGFCQDCESGCSSCRESWDGRTSICSTCDSRDLVPSGSRCVPQCRLGQFLEYKACKDCAANCLMCTSPTGCTKCHMSMMLYNGLCVSHCGQGQFEDGSTMSCTNCSTDCLRCYSGEECSTCNSDSYLKGGNCVRDCGAGYMSNSATRECVRNSAAPTFQILRHVQVPQGGITPLDPAMFYISDPDTASENLVIMIVRSCDIGDVIVVREGVDVVLATGDYFTLVDVMEGKVRFLHHEDKGSKGTARLRVSDGQLSSQARDLYFQATTSRSLAVIVNAELHAVGGSVTPLARDVLDLRTSGEPGDVTIAVLSGPGEGDIVHSQQAGPVRRFSLRDLRLGHLGYRHDPRGSAGTDTVLLQATDGYSVLTFMLSVVIRARENHVPILMNNKVGHVTVGGMIEITSELLLARATDEINTPMDDTIYTLVPPLDNPQEGDVIMVVPIPESGPGHGWEDMGNGQMAARMSRFLQRDIDEGRIWYRNRGTAALTDIVRFEVADTSTPANILADQSFRISVRERDHMALSRPTLVPGVRLGVTVLEKQIVPITSVNLAFRDLDTANTDIVYVVTRPLGATEGTLEHLERPLKPVDKFTQEDINNNRIIYRPPTLEIGHKVKEVGFYFTVSDAESDAKSSPEHKFNIHIVPVNNKSPVFGTQPHVITVSQGGSVPVAQSVLGISDEDTPLAELVIKLVGEPQHGQIEKVDGAGKTVLRQGDKFHYSEMGDNSYQYSHDGSGSEMSDSVELSASDGVHETVATLTVRVLRVDKSAPYMLATASCRLEIVEGSVKSVTRDHLAFADADGTDDTVTIMLTRDSVHGKLLLNNNLVKRGGVFTQANINQGDVSFLADVEIGQKSVTEVMTFNVTDASGNVLPSQSLTVLIHPDNNQPPMVKVNKAVKVDEGGEVPLTGSDIMVTDPDSQLSDLVVVIETLPIYGSIIDRVPAEGSDLLEDRLVSSFPVQDLIDGYVSYNQSDHANKEPARDSFLFHVTDGENQSPRQRFNISITLVNDEAPMLVSEQVFVREGQPVLVTNATLYVVDIDTKPDNLIFTLQAAPVHGTLRKKSFTQMLSSNAEVLSKGTTFTYKDIQRELLLYQNDGTEVSTDSFTLHLTDGRYEVTRAVSVIIGLVNDETPRVTINRGLRVQSGSTTPIKSEDLRSSDIDSDDSRLTYTITRDAPTGSLLLKVNGRERKLSAAGPDTTFYQIDINNGNVEYRHEPGERTGNVIFKFTVSDSQGNDLIDQDFHITVLEDRYPPKLLSNKEIIVTEGGRMTITTEYLSFTDDDSEPSTLKYTLIEVPQLGRIQLSQNPGVPVTEFRQSDIAGDNVVYVHTSTLEKYTDKFTFSVSDGTNEVVRMFSINISPVDDSIPVVTNHGLRVQEGVRKLITEFELKAVDKDTKEDSIEFTIVNSVHHGNVEIYKGGSWRPALTFTMTDIYENRVSYHHDGSETTADSFSFTVSDGTNTRFASMQQDDSRLEPVAQADPQPFDIDIIPTDDGSPIIQANLGLQYLEISETETSCIITSQALSAVDVDTPADKLQYLITVPTLYGQLEKITRPGREIAAFTQADIDEGIVKYVLTASGSITHDSFTFDLIDTKPNRIVGIDFHITWSTVGFEGVHYNVTETLGVVNVPVVRTGNLKQYSIVTCRTRSGTATSNQQGTRPGLQDYVEFTGQVQFDEWQDTKMCTIIINDDSIFEGPENFYVELVEPTFTLLGANVKATIAIYDIEDEPVLEFKESIYNVGEGDGYLAAQISRQGDVSSTVTVICFTTPLTARGSPLGRVESGSDYISRGNTNSYRVVFPAGVTIATCDVKIIDDSLNEPAEQFELELSSPTYGASLGPVSTATVIIEGPNDESMVYFSSPSYHFLENAGTIAVEIVREGLDLSHTSVVWCATRLSHPPSAAAGQDYAPSSSQITFGPGQTTQRCELTILDDDMDPRREGNETFTLFLSSAIGSNLIQPYIATLYIDDSDLDVPTMHFLESAYTIEEKARSVTVPVYRSGDVSFPSSVICYTRQQTAKVMMDYDERMLTEDSMITFKPGDKIKNCTVGIVDDDDYEPDETFVLRLAQPLGTEACPARIGKLNITTITIRNDEDVPRIQFERAAYSIQEPSIADQVAMVKVKVTRSGDLSQSGSVRCSTRDGSAMSGTDYNPRSQLLHFNEGVSNADFTVDILYNSDIEWHEAFSIVLGPGEPIGAVLGPVSAVSVTILDNDVSGSLVLPATPLVVSLLQYDDAESGTRIDPSPGYPLVCITPCDLHYPTYTLTQSLCEESKINQSTMYYRWEVAMPESGGSRPPFVELSDNTLFTSVNQMVLDSVYFRPSFRVRCVAQPLDENGNPGIPLKSKPIDIGRQNGICKAPVFPGLAFSYQAQSFLANLAYVGADDPKHPNTIHISVKVPHQDGMLPLISTFPLHNLRFLLSEPVYRQQHICSNLITPQEWAPLLDSGFLQSGDTSQQFTTHGHEFPYQFDTHLRENKTLLLYRHLNLKSCIWTFDAYYHVTDLVDLCGGRAVSDFQVTDGGQTYLTVRVPLHVSYLYATAPVGWGSLEHRTEMEFSFYYDTVLWRAGLETSGDLGGKLQVMKILIDEDGKLVIDFKTQAKFRGLYVLKHHTLPGYKSRVVAGDKAIGFDLNFVWGQNTFDGPHQLWRATSDYSIKDYTGEYVVELIPCTVQPNQGYTIQSPVPCTAHQPLRFEVPIAFQQTNRPVPLEYSLNTQFHLYNIDKLFLSDPFSGGSEADDMDFDGSFSQGQKLYGRVLWSPSQDLKHAYRLHIEKVFLCAGANGYIPTYDPLGQIYNEGPQFGCIQPGPRLKYRFMILDRGNPDVTTRRFQNIPFDAEFADENPDYMKIASLPGVDGFAMSIDPLYKVTSGYQWHMQVIYTIGPADSLQYRSKRSAILSLVRSRRDLAENVNRYSDWIENNSSKNGTNIKVLHLNYTHTTFAMPDTDSTGVSNTDIIVICVVGVVVIVGALLTFVIIRKRKRHKRQEVPQMRNNLELPHKNSIIYKGNQNIVKSNSGSIELKNTTIYKGERGKHPMVRVKDTNLRSNGNRLGNNGTEV